MPRKLLVCLCSLCLLYSCASIGDLLRVVSEAWPPSVFERDGQHLGVDTEIAQHVSHQLAMR